MITHIQKHFVMQKSTQKNLTLNGVAVVPYSLQRESRQGVLKVYSRL